MKKVYLSTGIAAILLCTALLFVQARTSTESSSNTVKNLSGVTEWLKKQGLVK